MYELGACKCISTCKTNLINSCGKGRAWLDDITWFPKKERNLRAFQGLSYHSKFMCIDSHWGKGTTESHSQTSPPCHHSSPSHDSLISTLTILFHLGCLGPNIASVKLGNKYDIFRLRYPAAYKERFKWKDLVIIFLLFTSTC